MSDLPGFRYAICSLRHRRAEIDRDIGQLALQAAHKRRERAKVDAVLRILAPGSDPAQIRPKKAIRYLNLFRQGELGQILIGLLRASGRPMSNIELATLIIQRGGYDQALWTPIRRRCRANLEYLEAQKRIAKIGHGRTAIWALDAKWQ
jgi:hypothetical protein